VGGNSPGEHNPGGYFDVWSRKRCVLRPLAINGLRKCKTEVHQFSVVPDIWQLGVSAVNPPGPGRNKQKVYGPLPPPPAV